MKLKSNQPKATAEQVVKDIRRATRRHYSTEDKIRIVLSGLRGEDSIAELCRKEGIAQGLYYSWSKEFLEAGKKRLAGDTARAANNDEVRSMRSQTQALKEAVADLTLENRLLKKSMIGDGRTWRHWASLFILHTGVLVFPDPEGLHAAFIEFASPDHDLVGIADVIDRCDLPARKLLTVLMRQYLQLELRTVLAALRT